MEETATTGSRLREQLPNTVECWGLWSPAKNIVGVKLFFPMKEEKPMEPSDVDLSLGVPAAWTLPKILITKQNHVCVADPTRPCWKRNDHAWRRISYSFQYQARINYLCHINFTTLHNERSTQYKCTVDWTSIFTQKCLPHDLQIHITSTQSCVSVLSWSSPKCRPWSTMKCSRLRPGG